MKKNNNEGEKKNITVNSFAVKRVNQYNNTVYADVEINEITIYGMRVIEGKQGGFLAFPSYKGKDDKYYNNCYACLSDEDSSKILAEIERKLNS